MAELDGPRWGPANGLKAKQLIVLCHGVGADGNDLIDLGPYWSRVVPDAAFAAPHAPEPFDMAPVGRQWFPIGLLDPVKLGEGVRKARIALDRFIDAELARLDLPESAYALMGFSQGAMTALFTGLRRHVPPRAILAYSGALLAPESLVSEITGKPPVTLIHGEADGIVPISRSRDAERALTAAGVSVQTLYVPGLAHGIDESGLSLGATTLQRAFPKDP